MDTFLVRTEPDSSMVKPAHIHITRHPQMRNEKVFRTNCNSLSTAASTAVANQKNPNAAASPPATARRP